MPRPISVYPLYLSIDRFNMCYAVLCCAVSCVHTSAHLLSAGNQPNLQEITDIHALTGVLKLAIRELPEPLLTYPLYTPFVKLRMSLCCAVLCCAVLCCAVLCCAVLLPFLSPHMLCVCVASDDNLRLEKIKDLINQLPPSNQAVIEYLMVFLKRVFHFFFSSLPQTCFCVDGRVCCVLCVMCGLSVCVCAGFNAELHKYDERQKPGHCVCAQHFAAGGGDHRHFDG